MKKTHFVFDFDDTLTDSYDYNQQMFVDTFVPYLDLSNKETETFIRNTHYSKKGQSMHDLFQEVTSYFSLNLIPQTLVDQNELMHAQNSDKIKIFDAVEDFIKELCASGKKVSICTNRQTKSLMGILNNNNLTQCFDNIISCADQGHEKPDPYCLEQLIKNSGQPKEEFIYFGDSKTDYLFASNAGIDFIIIDHYLNEKKFYKMMMQSFVK